MVGSLLSLHCQRIIHSFTDLCAEIPQPGLRASSVHDPTQKAKALGHIRPILPKIVLQSSSIVADPLIEIRRTREYVGRMTLLGNLDYNRAFELEDVLVPEQKHFAGALAELAIVEPIIVRLPGDRRDVEIRRNAQLVANTVQFLALERLLLQPEADPLDGVEELAEPVMQLAGIRQDFLRITGECDFEATGQGRLPIDQMPLAVAKPVFPALNECRLHAQFCADQVPPLVPRRVEPERKRNRIQDHLCFAPAVAIDRIAVVELNSPEGSPKSPLPTIDRKSTRLNSSHPVIS